MNLKWTRWFYILNLRFKFVIAWQCRSRSRQVHIVFCFCLFVWLPLDLLQYLFALATVIQLQVIKIERTREKNIYSFDVAVFKYFLSFLISVTFRSHALLCVIGERGRSHLNSFRFDLEPWMILGLFVWFQDDALAQFDTFLDNFRPPRIKYVVWSLSLVSNNNNDHCFFFWNIRFGDECLNVLNIVVLYDTVARALDELGEVNDNNNNSKTSSSNSSSNVSSSASNSGAMGAAFSSVASQARARFGEFLREQKVKLAIGSFWLLFFLN